MEIKEYKRREFLGDRLLGFIVGDIQGNDYKKCIPIVNNDNLAKVAQSLGLIPHPENIPPASIRRKMKIYADAYEVRIYEIYIESGIDAVKQFVLETLF